MLVPGSIPTFANRFSFQLLVTTNDSRIRLYDMDDYSMLCKYKGLTNDELQIRAHFSADGKQIICGSENQHVYVWSAQFGRFTCLRVI